MMDENNRNMLLAILLSGLVLIGWHLFYAGPKMQEAQEREKRIAAQKASQVLPGQVQPAAPGTAGGTAPVAGAPVAPGGPVNRRTEGETLDELPLTTLLTRQPGPVPPELQRT